MEIMERSVEGFTFGEPTGCRRRVVFGKKMKSFSIIVGRRPESQIQGSHAGGGLPVRWNYTVLDALRRGEGSL
jgi:hypothetical protein